MTRSQQRAAALVFLFAVAGLLIYLGFEGWVVGHLLPAQYLGYLIAAYGALGLFGVNVWYGGPLDPRTDPAPAEPEEDAVEKETEV